MLQNPGMAGTLVLKGQHGMAGTDCQKSPTHRLSVLSFLGAHVNTESTASGMHFLPFFFSMDGVWQWFGLFVVIVVVLGFWLPPILTFEVRGFTTSPYREYSLLH